MEHKQANNRRDVYVITEVKGMVECAMNGRKLYGVVL
jgi:hypothetical protein